jgi:hypothetical protein
MIQNDYIVLWEMMKTSFVGTILEKLAVSNFKVKE